MSLPELDNLVRIGQLKAEARNVQEVSRMLAMAETRLCDAVLVKLSLEGRFTSAYNAAHAAALAALRWHGYRSENRYTVFQSLTHSGLARPSLASAGRRSPKTQSGGVRRLSGHRRINRDRDVWLGAKFDYGCAQADRKISPLFLRSRRWPETGCL